MNQAIKLAAATALFTAQVSSHAHGTADHHLVITLSGERIKMNMTVDDDVLGSASGSGDRVVTVDTLRDEKEALERWAERSFLVADDTGSPGTVVFHDMTTDLTHADPDSGAIHYARVLRTVSFGRRAEMLYLDLSSLARLIPELKVTLVDATSGRRYRLLNPGIPQSVPIP